MTTCCFFSFSIIADAFATVVAGLNKTKGLRENIMASSQNKNKDPVSTLESRATQYLDVEVGRVSESKSLVPPIYQPFQVESPLFQSS